MKTLYLCTFRVGYLDVRGHNHLGEKEHRLVWAEDELNAESKLESILPDINTGNYLS